VCKTETVGPVYPACKPMSATGLRRKFVNVAAALLACVAVASATQNSPQNTTQPAEQNQSAPQQPQPQPAPAAPSEQPGAAGPESKPSAQPGPGAPVDSNTYKIGPADVLNIRVWDEPQFSGPVSVHQDGQITLPLVGDLPAGGKTPNDVQQIVAKALTKFVVKPLVTVTVQSVESKKYYMDGLIAHPGEYLLVTPTTVLEAISKAGGLQEFGNGKKIYILRGSERIPFNYKEVLHGKNMAQNIQVQPGDHVVVP
jgi:polysaccharide biosynthesis/export protein